MAEAHGGAGTTATVLCTDLVGSTELMLGLGEAAFDDFRRRHFEDLRQAIAAHDGRQIKTLGDGVLAVFRSAADALACAVRMQQQVERSSAPRVRIRAGLALGDVAFEDSDVFGAPVVEASRLTAAAAGGQILCTALVPVVAGGRSPHPTTALEPMLLKGLPEPVAVCEVVWEPAPTAEPPAPPVRHGPSRLPAPATPFLGRAGELAQVRDMLEQTRLLTVLGPGGAGKTRLALAAAQASAQHFPDGAYFAELAPVTDPDRVAAAVVVALGLEVQAEPGPQLERHLHGHLADRQVLLVLDNCEHLTAGERQSAHERHAEHFAQIARRWVDAPGEPWWAAADWPRQVDDDEENFRSAVVALIAAEDADAAVAITAALFMYWMLSSLLTGTRVNSDYAEVRVKPRDRVLACVGGVS